MAQRVTEILVGAGVVAVAAGFLVYAAGATGLGQTASDASRYEAVFRSVQGVNVGTDVRLGGVKVGSVTALDLNPENFRAVASFTVDRVLNLPEDTAVIVASEGLLGGNYIEVQPGGSPFNLEPGATITDTQGAVSLVSLLLKFVSGDSSAE
ncbi:outer membrane lipid asymmetry maintenance protein MlaD [Anianabacter salinae]|uniref:outer membrane lipid asymmetry maintenance protein MlaD n=1 Tax=Anianabacter salinae TaxID=2851023 RepID=UPI00225DF712|nr:outer membrane lipid asymmetry maintenance protein MlaD [Anianabacter salinae]MBV0912333.1 outer membrane lipid asymmetry maintenance protein MlaD [Anianabacter salinae]